MNRQQRQRIGVLCLVAAAASIGFYFGQSSLAHRMQIFPVAPQVSIDPAIKVPEISSVTAASPSRTDVASTPNWDDRWNALLAKPGTRARDAEILAALEELATRDPARAISLALNETRLPMRQEMLRATLRGWAQSSPDAAADWAVSQQDVLAKADAVGVVFVCLVRDPEALLRLNARLSQQLPELASSLGLGVINTLAAHGDFARAANFAVSGSPTNLQDRLALAYSSWADYQPQTALAAANALTNTNHQNQALDAIISTWSNNDPKAVVQFAATLPQGHNRELAFTDALRNWAANDPVAAGNWISSSGPRPELDAGIASIATSSLMKHTPALATDWAENITSPPLRSSTIAEIVHQWSASDPIAARSYVQMTPALPLEDRSLLLAELDSNAGP